MTTLYHAWSSMPAQSVRLGLAYKNVPHDCIAFGEQADELCFELGIALSPLAIRFDGGGLETDAIPILEALDSRLGGTPILDGVVDALSWRSFLRWRACIAPLLERLSAPALAAFADIAASDAALAAYKAQVRQRFGMSAEELSNDRYDGFRQFAAAAGLRELSRRLVRDRFYCGRLSAADLILACELFPLQLLDGVCVPMDLMYYIDRVEKACGASPRDGLIAQL